MAPGASIVMRKHTAVRYHIRDRNGPNDKVAYIHRIESVHSNDTREMLEYFEGVVQRFKATTICIIVDVAQERKSADVLERLNLLVELGYKFEALEHLAQSPKGQSVRLMCEKKLGAAKKEDVYPEVQSDANDA